MRIASPTRKWRSPSRVYRTCNSCQALLIRGCTVHNIRPTQLGNRPRCRFSRTGEPDEGGAEVSRIAVVTGAGSGMGRAICRHLAEAGHKVAALDIDAEAAGVTASELVGDGFSALGVPVDVSDRPAVDAALSTVRQELGPIEIMVTSAGIERFEEFLSVSAEDWDRMLAVNLTGTFHCIQASVPDMIAARWGRVVTISSSSAQS